MHSDQWINKTILITGGAGSIASQVVKELIKLPVKTVRVFDIDENALFKLGREIGNNNKFRPLLGDVRDRERVKMAVNGVDIIIHTAAIKNIEVSEYNAPETCRTNIDGTTNLIEIAMSHNINKFIFISSDKAVVSSTLYGATKYVGEKLVMWASKISLSTKFCVLRFGNVIETRGNVFDVWRKDLEMKRPLTITDTNMTRYFWHINEATTFILDRTLDMVNGYIYVPKMKEKNIMDLACEFIKENNIKLEYNVIGLRCGEKMDEYLFSVYDESPTDKGSYWEIKG